MLGACCLGSECHETTEEACVGQWLGANTVCEEETCDDGDTIIGPFQWTIEEGGNDHWYAIVVSGAICWDEANTEALADGAYLLSVTTVDELAWWLSTFAGTGQEPLIGLHQLAGSAEPSDGWEWSNGEGDTLQNWASGTPDDATGESNVAQLFSTGYWDDVLGCGATSYAIEYGQWFNVCETCEYQTIQAAVNDASSTETIYVDAGIYTSVDGTSLVDLQGKNISIIGKGASQTILDGQHAVSGLRYALATGETSTIQGVTIKDCVGGDGPAITVSGGELVLINTALLDNVASGSGASGGAILASGGVSLVVQGAEFSRNSSITFGGAILLTDSGTTAQITDCLFGENESFYGGAIYVSDATTCTVDLVEFTNNTAAVDGGAVSITGDGSSFTSCCFRGNVAGNVGGAIDNRIGADTLLSESIFSNNTAVYEGGALYNDSSSPYIYTCTFASNSSNEENGGGIHNDNDSMPSIEATLFCGNTGRGESESTLEGHIYPTVADVDYEFVGGNEFHALCSTCQGDVNGDGIIDLSDLLAIAMLSVWGECNDCLADLDNNGVVDSDDILILIELLTSRLDHPCDVECPYRY
jgi:predicted outer membrane repeat protein